MIVKDSTKQTIKIVKGSRAITAANIVGSDSMRFEFKSASGDCISICLSDELMGMMYELLDVIGE